MERVLQEYGRYLLLEGKLSALEREKETARREALAAQRELSQKRLEWERLQNPSLFQRMMGKLEEKQEKAHREYRLAEKQCAQAERRATETLCHWEQTREDLEALSDLPRQYQMAKSPENDSMAVRHFRPAALYHTQVILEELEQAVSQAREEAARSRIPHAEVEEKLNHLAQAREGAEKLSHILAQFPPEEHWGNDYLNNPDGFLLAAATKYSRLDRLNAAIGQMRTLRERLQSI